MNKIATALLLGGLCSNVALAACNDPPAPKVNWFGCDLSERDLSGADLREAIFSNTTLHRTVLANAILTGADFETVQKLYLQKIYPGGRDVFRKFPCRNCFAGFLGKVIDPFFGKQAYLPVP